MSRTRYTNRLSPGSIRNPGVSAVWWPDNMGDISELIEYSDVESLTGTVLIGTIPAGARYLGCDVKVITAFNAGAADDLIVGIVGDLNYLLTNGHPTTADSITEGELLDWTPTADTLVYATFTHTGAAPTTGKAVVTVKFEQPL